MTHRLQLNWQVGELYIIQQLIFLDVYLFRFTFRHFSPYAKNQSVSLYKCKHMKIEMFLLLSYPVYVTLKYFVLRWKDILSWQFVFISQRNWAHLISTTAVVYHFLKLLYFSLFVWIIFSNFWTFKAIAKVFVRTFIYRSYLFIEINDLLFQGINRHMCKYC